MTKLHAVDLISMKTGATTRLEYSEAVLARSQARFIDRTVLAPVQELDAFRCSAVVDWIELEVDLRRKTQFQRVHAEIKEAIGQACWVKLLTSRATTSGTRFRVRFQQPTMVGLHAARIALDAKFGIQSDPAVSSLEISVDFRPRTPLDAARKTMVGLLVRHHLPDRDMLSTEDEMPRFRLGSRLLDGYVFPWSQSPNRRAINQALRRSNEGDRAAPVDGTFYIGKRDGPVMWRTMDKTIDQQNRPSMTRVDLEAKECRARIEVTLDRDELDVLGIQTLSDFASFNFVTLQRRYFKFMLPTFANCDLAPIGLQRTMRAYLERERRTKFLTTGVLGLLAMDQAILSEQTEIRRHEALRQTGNRMKQPTRVGGAVGTLIAYARLNSKVETALRHLRDSVRSRGR